MVTETDRDSQLRELVLQLRDLQEAAFAIVDEVRKVRVELIELVARERGSGDE